MTFGFNSAVEIATNVIDCIHTTATSHGRVFIVEIMGHKVGWLTLYAGIAGGADVILLPEIPYDINKVVDSLYLRTCLLYTSYQTPLISFIVPVFLYSS